MNNNIIITLPILILSFLLSCKGSQGTYALTQTEAENRASLLSNIQYKLNIHLMSGDSFQGIVEISFDTWKSDTLRVDYFVGDIKSLTMNGRNQKESIQPRKGFFLIPANLILKGKNVLNIEFKTPYSRTGNGLHKFIDPDDKEIYLHSQFEAFHANKMFPCFDQPDLKATYRLVVDAPKRWKVISSTLADSISPSQKNHDFSTHHFLETKKFSPYVFSLHAGPFQNWNDKYNSIPLSLYARQSMAKYVNPADWFKFTKDGFAFYEGYFDYPYPFSKYDQILVPEFNFGAMENVGAVTFSERFITRSQMTRAQRENLSDVILHEMAHMWFGNLVTMKWWNGLWLNESFATYMASLAQERNSEFHETWQTFFDKMKQWAYDEDSFRTNHPIESKVINTDEAFTQFDGITYGKGASVLKQLVFLLGDDAFKRGVQNYLKRYAFSNSTLKDFLFELELASGLSLKKWSRDWLETKGTNEIEFVSECNQKFLHWRIVQHSPGDKNRFRDHKTNLVLYKLTPDETNTLNNSFQLKYESFPIIYSGRSTSFIQPVTFCPDFILVNADDQDFVIWKWDKIEIEKLKVILTKDTDSFRKLIIWNSIYNQIELGNLTFNEFKELAIEILPKEENTKLTKWILGHLASDSGYTYFTSRFWFSKEQQQVDFEYLSIFLMNGLLKAKPDSDEQRYWFSSYLDSAYLDKDQDKLFNLYLGNTVIKGLRLDQDQKWAMLTKLSSLGYDKVKLQKANENEKKIDQSSRGINSSLVIDAIRPENDAKTKWFNVLLKPKESNYSSSTLRVIAYHLFPIYQKELQLPFLKSYLYALGNFDAFDDENYLDGFSKSLAPNFCSNESKVLLSKFVNSHPKLPPAIRKTLLKQVDIESKCILMRKKNTEP